MPDKTYNNILVDLPTKAKDIYLEMEKEFIVQLQDDTITAANAAVKTSKLRQITAGCLYNEEHKYKIIHKAKIDALKEIIEGIDGNVLLGFQFKFERDMIQQAIPEARFIDGSTNMKDSMQNIKDFNSNKIKLLCCHPASTSHGINLQKFCNTLVWLSRDFSLERTGQYEARIHRQGQTKKVFIHTIACKNTIDLAVIAALSRKSEGQSATINALKDYVKNK
jgi:SNF2 family DNA or RNA helicase